MIIEGHWVPVLEKGTTEIPIANSVHLECHRDSQICTESMAKLITPLDDPSAASEGHLFVFVQSFKIRSWSDALIVAKAEPRAADVEIRISVSKGKGTVERFSTETNARGAENPRPGIDRWLLK